MSRTQLKKNKKSKPLVTIYITNYNYGSFIEKSIRSALAQHYENFEILIIDDGSTDDSRKKIEKFSSNKKIRIIYKKRSGLVNSNNLAIKVAKGEYITRLDADDWLDPNFLHVMVNSAIRNQNIAMVFCNYYLTNYKGEIVDQFVRKNFNKSKLKDQPAHGACSLIKSTTLKKIGGYDEQFRCQDGVDLWFKIIKKYKIEQVNLPLFYYRQHRKSLSKNTKFIAKTKNEIIQKHSKNLNHKFKNIIAIIPIRDQESAKNFIALRKISNKNVLEFLIEKLKKIKLIKKIIISTPDKKIQQFVKKNYKQNIFIDDRDKNLARLNTPIEKTIEIILKKYKIKKSASNLLLITNVMNPLIKSQDYEAGINLMSFFNLDSAIGVCKENDIFYSHNGDSLVKLTESSSLTLERDEIYRGIGGLMLVRSNKLGKGKKIGQVILDKYSSLLINSDDDFKIAKYFIKSGLV